MSKPESSNSSNSSNSDSYRSDRIRSIFDRIAAHYDLLNDLQSLGMHRIWKRKFISLAAPSKRDHAIDLCCGSGDISLRLAQSAANVIGIDFSQKMLDIAKSRAAAIPNLRFVNANVLRLPFENDAFDLATIAYGLRNLTNFNAALAEFLRILKPKGRLLILDFGKPENALLRKLYLSYLRHAVPILGNFFCKDREAYEYIFESLIPYPAQKGVANSMISLSMKDVKVHSILGGAMCIHSAKKPNYM